MTVRGYELGKRVLDVAGSAILLVGLAPLLAAAAVAVRLDSKGPAVYRAERVGRDGRSFCMYKFRTMFQDADDVLHRQLVIRLLERGSASGPDEGRATHEPALYKVEDDPRVTRVGRLLRATSIDELPQLLNVLRGDMSLVGPRPDVSYAVERYAPWHRRRLEVKPGMTGMWQVSGRALLSPADMLRLDVEYVERRSTRLDLVILLRTVPAVLGQVGSR